MKRTILGGLILSALLAGCGAIPPSDATSAGTTGAGTIPQTSAPATASGGTSPSGSSGQTKGTLPPVESRSPNSPYQAAVPGQTRAPGVKTVAAYDVRIITDELDSPWGIKELPDGRFAVTQKEGTLRLVSLDGTATGPIGGFPEVESGQGGLLDVLVAPDFSQSRMLYFTLAEKTEGGSLTAVGKGRLSDDESRIEAFAIIYRAVPAYRGNGHFGSRLVFDRDGYLIVSTGDRQSSQTRGRAQELDNGYGKTVRITTEGAPAPDNPLASDEFARPEIYTYGHRNVQGLAVHPQTGEIWASEMGPRGGDELNLIKAGRNYGWPIISYGLEYIGSPVLEGITAKDGMEQPIYYWDPVIAPSGMTFYASDAIPEWNNNLFIGGLAGQHIARLILDGAAVIGEERLLAEEGQRFRDITQGQDGALYAVTDGGRLYRIGPKE